MNNENSFPLLLLAIPFFHLPTAEEEIPESSLSLRMSCARSATRPRNRTQHSWFGPAHKTPAGTPLRDLSQRSGLVG